MDRLTSNKDVKDMGMVELAYNSCYARNGKARYRDYDSDIDARQLVIQLLERYADIPNEFTCDDDFDERMIGYMSYGIENPEGLIALVYRSLWAMADLRERLKRYEDTNLTPEKILEIDKMYQELSNEVMKYRKVATVDDFKMYISMFNPEVIEEHMTTLKRIIHNHGTLRELLDECEEYKEIGTVEECRLAVKRYFADLNAEAQAGQEMETEKEDAE